MSRTEPVVHDHSMASQPVLFSFRLRGLFYARLILKEAWKDEMKEATRLAVKQSGGISEITMDELVFKLLPTAKAQVPTSVEADMKREIFDACKRK